MAKDICRKNREEKSRIKKKKKSFYANLANKKHIKRNIFVNLRKLNSVYEPFFMNNRVRHRASKGLIVQ